MDTIYCESYTYFLHCATMVLLPSYLDLYLGEKKIGDPSVRQTQREGDHDIVCFDMTSPNRTNHCSSEELLSPMSSDTSCFMSAVVAARKRV